MKSIITRIANRIYRKIFVTKRIIRQINGTNNRVFIGKNLTYGTLHIIINGNNNTVNIGDNCRFYGENWIFLSGDGNKLTIGNLVSFDNDVHFILAEGTSVNVGDDCMFAKHINVRTSDQHGIYNIKGQRINLAKDVTIGNHVWVCASVLIMKGVSIGSGSVIGIESMVTKNIPENCIAVGRPAKVIKDGINWTRSL